MLTANTCLPPVEIPEIVEILGKNYTKTGNEVLIRALCQRGIQVILDCRNTSEIIAPKDLGFSLSETEVKSIEDLDVKKRFQYFKTTSVVENRNYPKSWTKEPGFGDAVFSDVGFESIIN